MGWKAFKEPGLNALLNVILRIKETVDDSLSTVSSLSEDFVNLSKLTTEKVAGKQDKPSAVSIVIPAAGWAADNTADYPNYYDINVSGVTASDRASVDIAPASLGAAVTCGLCPACETLAGKIRIRAASVPAASMAAHCWIEKGA